MEPTVTIRKKFNDEIDICKAYIAVILAFSGRTLPYLEMCVIAYLIKYGKISRDVRELISTRENADPQSIANALTRIRKTEYVTGNQVNSKLIPPTFKFDLKLQYQTNENGD